MYKFKYALDTVHFIAAHTNNNCHNLYLKYEVLNVHRALSDIYLSCSKRACPTLLDSYIYKCKYA